MEFRVLGPFEVWSAGVRVTLGGPKDRILLGVLVLHANRVVAVERLIEALWGDRPPQSARKNVQTHVWALRRLLGSGQDGERIASGAAGYQLRVGSDDQVDQVEFERLVTDGQQALAGGEVARAATALRAALALWRGQPFCDVPFAGGEHANVSRLEERRLEALEDRIEADLAAGGHASSVGELRELVAAHPLRERLHGQLMLALYRCGRQGEALAAYTAARDVLRDELGLDPGTELRLLQQRLLARDPGLDLERPAGTPHPVNQLPPDVADFTGRTEESVLAGVSVDTTTSGQPPIVVTGPAGVGKTAFAVHLAHRYLEDYPDGQLAVDLHGFTEARLGTGEALGRFLRALGVADARLPGGIEERVALYRSLLAGRRCLVLLDNAHDEAQVRPLLPGTSRCLVLITSRNRLFGLEGARVVTLDVLPEADARTLLSRVVGPQRAAAEPAATAEVARLCGYLPLALRVAGARLAARPTWRIEKLVRRFTDERERLGELVAGDLAVRGAFELSYRALDVELAALFRLLGLIEAPDFCAGAVAALTGLPARAAERLLERLVDAHLLEPVGHTDRYRLHDLLRLFARDRLEEQPEPDRQAALRRYLAWQDGAVPLAGAGR